MKVIFAGGGTGGHLFTGIALAERLDLNEGKDEVLFVGTSYGLENEIVPREGYRLEKIEVQPLKGTGLKARLKALLQVPASLWQSFRLLKREKPNLVMGIGGYASGPVTLMARLMGIQTAIVEQNSMPGFANRILGKVVHRVFIAFERARIFFPQSKTALTGNPVRKSFLQLQEPIASTPLFTLLVMGGSQGAHSINKAMMEMAPMLEAKGLHLTLKIIHQTGKTDRQVVNELYQKHHLNAEVFDFIADPRPYYAQANLVLCRSGAGSVNELQILGKPSLLVPYPYAADDHQRHNAMELVDAGAAVLILNPNLTAERLFEEVMNLLEHPETLEQMSVQAKRISKPKAAEDILLQCRVMCEKG